MIDPNAFQALAAGIGAELPLTAATQLLAYLDAMLAENEHINLTAVREREAAVMLHALDSAALALCKLGGPPRVALDLGTGNGFPGVAIACLFPDAKIALMDRRLKKLHAILRALGAAGFDTDRFELVHSDAAEAKRTGHAGRFDLVTTRAVGPPADVGKLAKPLLAEGGLLAAWLSDGTDAPDALKCRLRRRALIEYSLPAPADRLRRIAIYGRD